MSVPMENQNVINTDNVSILGYVIIYMYYNNYEQ